LTFTQSYAIWLNKHINVPPFIHSLHEVNADKGGEVLLSPCFISNNYWTDMVGERALYQKLYAKFNFGLYWYNIILLYTAQTKLNAFLNGSYKNTDTW